MNFSHVRKSSEIVPSLSLVFATILLFFFFFFSRRGIGTQATVQ